MFSFSSTSRSKLSQCHPLLQDLFYEVIKHVDCSIICGFRKEVDQNIAFSTGKSGVQWPDSNHNDTPSTAVDVVPYPIDWNDHNRFYNFVGFVRGIAVMKGIDIRVGADWDGDFEVKDQNFHDLPHFELIIK